MLQNTAILWFREDSSGPQCAKKIRSLLPDHSVFTAKEMGWAELSNGDLLSCAENDGFELMITCDQNLSYQQNLSARRIALIVLTTNNWKILQRNLRQIVDATNAAEPRGFSLLKLQR